MPFRDFFIVRGHLLSVGTVKEIMTEITIENVYDEDTDFDGVSPLDLYNLARELDRNQMPIPTDLIARLNNAGIYIAN